VLHAYWDRIFGGYSSPFGAVFDADTNDGITGIAVKQEPPRRFQIRRLGSTGAPSLRSNLAYAPPVSTGTNAVLLTREYETNARNIARSPRRGSRPRVWQT